MGDPHAPEAPAEPSDRAEILLSAGLALASELSLPAVLQRIVELAVDVTGARYGALGVLGPDGRIVEFVTIGVSEGERRAIGHPPIGRGILGVLISDARPLRLEDISRDPRSVGFPPNHPPMRTFMGAPVKARGRVFGNIYLTEKRDGLTFTDEDERSLLVLAAQAGVAVENARLYEEARQRERRLEAVREISAAILRGAELEDVLAAIARSARELVGAALATIAIPASNERLSIQAADGERAEALLGQEFSADGSVSGDVMRAGTPVVLDDASADDRAYQPVIRLGNVGPAIFVPLLAAGGAFGTLAVANEIGGRTFDQDDLAVVETFAGQAAVALEYARARRELERLVVMEDRERIAKELHDGVIQSLFAVGMGLQATAQLAGDADIGRRIEGAVSEVDRVIRDLRNYIFGLRPGILADRQLDQALRHLAVEFEERTGVTTVVDVAPQAAADLGSVAGDVVQLAREALSNVGRHASATTCRVSLHREDDAIVLEVDDDGVGFDPETAAGSRGQGLRNLRGRAEGMGGSLLVASVPGEGATVRVRLPA